MKKVFNIFIVMFICFLAFAYKVYALNTCSESSEVDCAYCKYSYKSYYPQMYKSYCEFTLSFTYFNNSEAIVTEFEATPHYDISDNPKGLHNLICKMEVHTPSKIYFKDNDDNVICPDINLWRDVAQGYYSNFTDEQYYIFEKNDSDSLFAELDESYTHKGNNNNNGSTTEPTPTAVCEYDNGDIISIIDGKVAINGVTGAIGNRLDARYFADNKCPVIYKYVSRTSDNTYSHNKPTFAPQGEAAQGTLRTLVGKAIDQNTGEYLDKEKGPNLEGQDCTSLFGDPDVKNTPAYYLNLVFNIMKYIAIIILIVATMMDFITAVAAHDDDAIKKATSKATMRLIFCILIFFLPMLIRFILKYLSDRAIDLCGIGG